MPGRPPIPFEHHEARGTVTSRVKKRKAKEFKVPTADIGKPPEWLGEYGRAEWEKLTSDETYKKKLNPLFWGALLEYCILFDRMAKTEEEASGGRENTGKALTATDRQMLGSLRMQLGLTLQSAPKIGAAPAEQAKDEWAQFEQQA